MKTEINPIQNFVVKFFTNLDSKIIEDHEKIIISNVKESFEKFYGKKSPYIFCFDKQNLSSNAELIERGNYLLTAISNYLENSGKTTLLKINFDSCPEKEVKKRISLKNCELEKMIPKKKYDFFYRFTFQTVFQYLNEREQIINDIYTYKGEIIEGNLENYNVSDGKKSEISIPDTEDSYLIAKDKIKDLLKEKINSIANDLDIRLQKEIERIEKHSSKETIEYKEIIDKHTKRLILLEKEMFENPSEELENRIIKQKSLIESIKNKNNSEDFEKNKLREVKLEEQKHALNINTKLINTTLIYYPLSCFDIAIKNGSAKRIIEISIDSLTGKMNDLFCECCEKNVKDIRLCSSNHISCADCLTICESCKKEYCKKCIKRVCELCNKKICNDCAVRCFGCGKIICKTHARKDKISDRVYCSNCLKRCERCEKLKNPEFFKKSPSTNADICDACYRKEMQEKTVKGIFKD